MHHIRTLAAIATALILSSGATACSGGSTGAAPSATRNGAPQRADSAAAVRPDEAIDELVAVDGSGARMHLWCSGSGSSTVVVVPGFGDDGTTWDAVASEVADEARVCIASRLGLGTSDPSSQDQTFASEADDLHAALVAAGEPGPFVVAGHSFGGAEAVAFADRFPDDVAGILLVDASPVTWPTLACAVPDDGSEVAASFGQVCASYQPGANPERLDAERSFAQVGEVTSLGDVPLVVMTRAEVAYDGLDPAAERDLAVAWRDGQAHWASLSSSSAVVPVPDTGHAIQLDQPAVVVEHLLDLVHGAA